MSAAKDGQCFLALDLGASSGRAMLGRFGPESLTLEAAHRFPNQPVEVRGTLYWDVLGLYREVLTGLGKARGLAGGKLAGVGVDAWGVDFGLLDAHGRLVSNPVHYRDPRTDGVMEKVFALVPRERVFELTGIQFLALNTLYQLAAMRFGAWPELERARVMLNIPDLFHYFLCGRQVSEFTIATTTQLFDPRTGEWSWQLIEALDLPRGIFGEVVRPGTVLGVLDGSAAAEAGRGVPVIAPASHDTGSAVAAVPVDPDATAGTWAYLSSGTWSLMGLELPDPIINAQSLARNFTNEGGVGRTWRLLKNIAGLWLLQECQRAWAREDGRETSFAELEALAARARPGPSLVDPDHDLFLRPGHMPAAIAEYCQKTGQPPPADRAQTVRCILASLALKYRQVRSAIEDVSGRRIERLHVVGGGSRSALLNRFTADALGLPVLAGPAEATAIGNLLVQAVAAGVVPDLAAARDLVRQSFPVEVYEPGEPGPWDEAAERFERLPRP